MQIHNGESCLPWEDNWMVIFPKLKYPELLSFAKKKKEKKSNISISALGNNQPNHLFHQPLSASAFSQLQALRGNLENLNLDDENDLWGYIWGSNNFSKTKV